MTHFNLRLSQLDTDRFGVVTAKVDGVTTNKLDEIDAFCAENNVEFLIARTPATQLDVVQAMESYNYHLMDTLLYYAFKHDRKPIPDFETKFQVRPTTQSDIETVRDIAEISFTNYIGHYHADPRLDNVTCDEVYIDWAVRSVLTDNPATHAMVAHKEGKIAGFVVVHMNNPEEGDVWLSGILPEQRGQGLHQLLMIESMKWSLAQGAKRTVVSTQVTNVPVQKAWTRIGFEIDHAFYTLHKWYDK